MFFHAIKSKKKTDLTGFFTIKPGHPDELKKKQIWVEKPRMGAL